MQWTLEQLRQFVTTAEQGSISAAARHLNKTQSAVSTAISLLEVDLGVELFDRSTYRASLTDAGKRLLLEAQDLLRQASSLERTAHFLSRGDDAKLTLAFDEALPYFALIALVQEVASEFPNLEFTLLSGTATEVAELVRRERADIAFHFAWGNLSDAFDLSHIGSLPQGVFVSSDHPLVNMQPIKRKDLALYRQLLIYSEDFDETVLSPKIWRADSFCIIAEMAALNLGWAILPRNIATEMVGFIPPLQELDCSTLGLSPLSVRMVWQQGKNLGETALWMKRRLSELFSS